MKRIYLLAMGLFMIFALKAQNPIAKFYNGAQGYPTWSDGIKWSNVITMTNKGSGTANFDEFEKQRDILFAQGGGVLYYPAGMYDFEVKTGPNGRGLLLKEGVVILGEEPTASTAAVVDYDNHGLNSLGTKFNFTATESGYQSNMNYVGCTPATANKVGIAWVQMTNAYVFMGFNTNEGWASTWKDGLGWLMGREISSWSSRVPDGTFIQDIWIGNGGASQWANGKVIYGQERFVFGVKMDNAQIRNYVLNKANCSDFKVDKESWRFGGVVSMYGHHIFVANNVVSKTVSGGGYNRLVLDINKQLLGLYQNRCDVENEIGYYGKDIVVQGNWFYNKGNKTYEVAGKNVIIRDNVAHKEYITLEGFSSCDGDKPTDDYMNRAYDLGGMNVWMHNNQYDNTGSAGNDGEGILGQRHNEVEIFSHAWTFNTGGPALQERGRGKGYMAPYDMHVAGLLKFKNTLQDDAHIGIDKPVTNYFADIASVSNSKNSNLSGVAGLSTCPSGAAAAPTNVVVTPVNYGNKITWKDNADNEIGFRVDRKIDNGTWETIAYRPRNEEGGNTLAYAPTGQNNGGPCDCDVSRGFDFNPQEWVDYLAPSNANVSYRVVAINCDDNETGSSSVITSVDELSKESKEEIIAYPNPTSGMVLFNIEFQSCKVVDVFGNVLLEKQSGMSVDLSSLTSGIYTLVVDGKSIKIAKK